MSEKSSEFMYYPTAEEVDAWVEEIWAEGHDTGCEVEMLPAQEVDPSLHIRHMRGFQYVRFSPVGMDDFYGYWQPAPAHPAPLLVHTPGYGAAFSVHPDLVMQGYNVLHVNPLGYTTPAGADTGKMRRGDWPVFPDTVHSGARRGYRQWLINCVQAVKWAQGLGAVIAERVSFFGTSQGGGGALLLGSVYQGRGVRCVAADEPFLTNFPAAKTAQPDWGAELLDAIFNMDNPTEGWRALGFVDTLTHARRLTAPVMLTAGGADQTIPPAMVEALFEKLPATKLYCYLAEQGHGQTQEFAALAAAWFRLYA